MIVNGIPQLPNENLREAIIKKSRSNLGVELHNFDICVTHRLPTRSNMVIPAILVQLSNRDKKNQLTRASKNMKFNGGDMNLNPSLPIFIDII